jgi:tetratricopeptide (TPR) repeat protein
MNTPDAQKGAVLSRRVKWFFAVFVLANLGFAIGIFLHMRGGAPSAAVSVELAEKALSGTSVFRFDRGKEFPPAGQNPKLFRQLDRVYYFDALLLAGDPAAFGPLLRHLRETKDWTLTYLDHTALGFRRAPAKDWTPADIRLLREKFAGRDTATRVLFLSGLASRLLAIDRTSDALDAIDEALKLDAKSPEALTQMAIYKMRFAMWTDALDAADDALAARKDYPPALAIRAQALYALRKSSDAYSASQKLLALAPEDPQTLFLHARIAHQAHAYDSEVTALRRLVELAEKANLSTSGYRIYLGQALAQRGDRDDALAEFQKAIDAGDLSDEQANFARETIRHIKGE